VIFDMRWIGIRMTLGGGGSWRRVAGGGIRGISISKHVLAYECCMKLGVACYVD
jgi:hypothetical protein